MPHAGDVWLQGVCAVHGAEGRRGVRLCLFLLQNPWWDGDRYWRVLCEWCLSLCTAVASQLAWAAAGGLTLLLCPL